MNRRRIWLLVVAGGTFAGGTATRLLFEPRTSVVAQTDSPLPARPTPVERREAVSLEQFDEVIRRIGPAVVAVDAVKATAPAAPKSKGKSEEESGSGVIVRLEGFPGCYAVTNNHV